MLRKVKGESHSYQDRDLELCTKIQEQPFTGRLYLETDIDRVRRFDELLANGSVGKEKNEKGLEKRIERGKEREKIKEGLRERDGGLGKGKKNDKENEKSSWRKDRRMERGREKEKKATMTSHLPPPLPHSTSGGRSNPCPVVNWPDGFPRMSYRSSSLPRPVNMIVSTNT